MVIGSIDETGAIALYNGLTTQTIGVDKAFDPLTITKPFVLVMVSHGLPTSLNHDDDAEAWANRRTVADWFRNFANMIDGGRADDEANEIHQTWSDSVATLATAIGVDPKSFDWSPRETTEETVGGIVGNIIERYKEQRGMTTPFVAAARKVVDDGEGLLRAIEHLTVENRAARDEFAQTLATFIKEIRFAQGVGYLVKEWKEMNQLDADMYREAAARMIQHATKFILSVIGGDVRKEIVKIANDERHSDMERDYKQRLDLLEKMTGFSLNEYQRASDGWLLSLSDGTTTRTIRIKDDESFVHTQDKRESSDE